MKRRLNFRSLMLGGALAAILPGSGFSNAAPLTVAPSASAATTVEGIAMHKTAAGLTLALETSGDSPQIVTASSGLVLQADIANAQLQLSEGESFTKKNPAPGIDSVELEAIGNNRDRLTVSGDERAPISEIQKQDNNDTLLISLVTRAHAMASPSKLPESLATVPGAAAEVIEPTNQRLEIAQVTQSDDTPEVLIPNPEVIIEGAPVNAPTLNVAPPFLPRAVAPPVGDISVSDIDSNLDIIDLGTAERVPRLVLRDASAREVLS